MSALSPETRGHWIPWAFAGFFVALTCPMLATTWLALTSSPGLVTTQAYQKGLDYNATLADAARQEALGWKGTLETHAAADGALAVRFALRDRDGQPIRNAQAAIWLVRPTRDGMDQKAALAETAPGLYAASLRLPAPGLWVLQAAATTPTGSWQMSRRAVLP